MKKNKSAKIVNFSMYSGYMPSMSTDKKDMPKTMEKAKKKKKVKENNTSIGKKRIREKKKNDIKNNNIRERNKNKLGITLFLFILFAIGIACFCLFTPLFNISEIKIIYNDTSISNLLTKEISEITLGENEEKTTTQINNNMSKYTDNEIINMSEIIMGNNIFKENLKNVKMNVESAPYIKNAKIERKFPGTLLIYIDERKINAYIDYVGSYICIDEMGYIVDSIKKEDKIGSIPVITGILPKDVVVGFEIGKITEPDDPVKLQRVTNLLNLIQKNELKLDISTIDVKDKDNVTVIIENGDKQINFGDMSNMNGKIMYLEGILEDKKGKKGNIIMNSAEDNLKPIFSENIGG